MTDRWNDDEQLAAFLDRRSDECERAKMLTRLAKEDDTYQVFVRTAVILSDPLLERMQDPEVRAATRRAFHASPDELREAAMEAARGGEG